MKHRVLMDLSFKKKRDAEEVIDLITPYVEQAENINLGENNEETSYIEYQECHHDEKPPKPCKILSKWEKGK